MKVMAPAEKNELGIGAGPSLPDDHTPPGNQKNPSETK